MVTRIVIVIWFLSVLVALCGDSQPAVHFLTIEATGIEPIVRPDALHGLGERVNVADGFSHRFDRLRVRESRERMNDVEPLGPRRVISSKREPTGIVARCGILVGRFSASAADADR